MKGVRAIDVQFPIGGLSKQFGYQNQSPFTAVDALNIWPYQWQTGRARGGTRLGIRSFGGSVMSTTLSWCPVSYVSGSTSFVGVAIAGPSSVGISVNGGDFNIAITGTASGTVADCTMFNNDLIHASNGGSVRYKNLATGVTNTLSWSGDYPPPRKCGLCAVHGNRLVLAGDADNPNVLYFSAIGDFTTEETIVDSETGEVTQSGAWDYSRTDRAAPWQSGGTNGNINEPIKSLIPHTHNCLIVGGENGMQVIRGNPIALHGEIDVLSFTVSPIGQAAWCKANNGWTYFMSTDGLYGYPPGCPDSPPQEISRKYLPDELVGLSDANGDFVSVAYDHRWQGIHIYVDSGSGADSWYFYSLAEGEEGFWPMHFSANLRLAANYKREVTDTDSALVAFSGSTPFQFTKDATESITSVLWYGPIKLGSHYSEGIINEIAATLAGESSDVKWGIYVGDSAQEAYEQDNYPREHRYDDASFVGVDWGIQGKNYVQNPQVSGQSAYLKVSGNGLSRISIEQISLLTQQTGMERIA